MSKEETQPQLDASCHLQCVQITVPEGDDAHVALLLLPSADDEENPNLGKQQGILENYFVQEVDKLKNYRVGSGSALPKKFPNKPPDYISKLMDTFLKNDESRKTNCKIILSNPESGGSRNLDTYWFAPVVVNHLRRALRHNFGENELPLAGFEICFDNTRNDRPVQVVMESVYTGDDGTDGEGDDDTNPVFEISHLTPLAEQLDVGIKSANTVLREMRYLDGRERLMRNAADKINQRIQSFSYISITVLLFVTYVQVSYLKRYFRKKKLM